MSKNKDYHDFAVLQVIDNINISGEQAVQNVGHSIRQVEKNVSSHNMQL
jgi:hypothetical protein